MKTEILFLINNLDRGGAERAFVRQMNALHNAGVGVYAGLLYPTAGDGYLAELELPQSRILQFDGKGWRVMWAHRVISKHNISVVYSTLEISNIVARLMKLLHPRIRVVIREGSARIDSGGRLSPKPVKFRVFDMLMNWAPSVIIAVSRELADALRSYQPHFARKIRVLENGVPITESHDELIARLQVMQTREEFRIFSAASMNYEERSFEYLIRALPLLSPRVLERTKLILAGDGRLRSRYQEEVRAIGLDSHVVFLGRIPTSALNQRYRESDVFVMCSTAEGSPNVIVEAMSFGLPVIATRVGGAMDMVSDRETGYFVPFRDARAIAEKLELLARDPQQRAAMGARSYERACARYSFDRVMHELRKALRIPAGD